MYRPLTKEESENANRTLDEWWEKLDFNAKIHFRNLVEAVRNPIDSSLPIQHADEHAVESYTISVCSCVICSIYNTTFPMCTIRPDHWNFHQACCGCEPADHDELERQYEAKKQIRS